MTAKLNNKKELTRTKKITDWVRTEQVLNISSSLKRNICYRWIEKLSSYIIILSIKNIFVQVNWRNMSTATFERKKKPAVVKVALNVVMNSATVLVLVKLWKLTRNDLQTTIMLTYVPISFFYSFEHLLIFFLTKKLNWIIFSQNFLFRVGIDVIVFHFKI